jgi:hypothetical protein
MDPTITQPGAVHPKNDMEGVNTPGAFTTFNDNTAIFCGNGTVTPAQGTGYYIGWLASTDNALRPFDKNNAAATFAAQLVLQQNKNLARLTPERPIPQGELLHMDGASLKSVLAPFASRLDELRDVVARAESNAGAIEDNDAMSRATGNVRTQGRTLPPF